MTRIDGLNQDKRIGPDPKTFEVLNHYSMKRLDELSGLGTLSS